MFKWMDRVYLNARKKIFKNLDTGEILNLELQDDPDNIVTESDTPLTAHCLNMAQQELVDDMSKTYTGTNITADTVAGYGRINKIYGNTVEEGTGDKSPDNPYTLKCVGDDVNLFDMNNSNKLSAYTEGSSNMIKSASHMKLIYIPCEPNTTYTSQKIISTNNNLSYTAEVPAVGVNFYGRVLNDSSSTCTITTGSNAKYLVLVYYDSSKDTVSEQKILNSIKIQKGSVATAWSLYGYDTVENISKNGSNTSSNIAYVDKPLCSIGDIRDELDYTNKKITRRCGYKIFNGSEDWWTGTSHTNCIGFETMLTGKHQIPQTCSHFKYVNNYNLDEPHMYIFNNTMYVFIPKAIASTLSEFKAWLASNPITVIYGLSTPTTESIDCSDKIVQYADSTNIYNTDGAEIEVSLNNSEAISDINENLKNVEKDVSEAISDINELDANIETRARREISSNFGLGGICKTISGNLNTACGSKTGFYMGFGLTNSPTNNSQEWFFIIHIVHNSSYQHQIAMSFNSASIYNRFMKDGVWSNWASR